MKKVKRLCLKCNKLFPSKSKTNRICELCSLSNENKSIKAEGVLDL